jgi:transcriptional regulator with XRE-family HTH domain
VELAELLRTARERKGLSKTGLAKILGVTHSAVSQWETGETAPSRRIAPKVADALGLDPTAVNPFAGVGLETVDIETQHANIPLLDWSELPQIKVVSMRRRGDRVSVDEDLPVGSFALKIADNAMNPMYRVGDIIVVNPTVAPRPRDVIVVLLKGEAGVLREYHPRGRDSRGEEVYDLVSTNADYPTITVNSANPGKVLGVVHEHRRKRPK